MHFRSPFLNFRGTYDESKSRLIRTAVIMKEDLLRYDDWNSKSLEFIHSLQDSVDILMALSNYRKTALRFSEWFQKEQEKIHRDELKGFKEKEGGLLALQLKDKLTRCLNNPSHRTCSESSLLFHILHRKNFEELSGLDFDIDERIDLVISMLSNRFEVTREMRDLIINVYNLPEFTPISSTPDNQDSLNRYISQFRQKIAFLLIRISRWLSPVN